MGKDTTSLGHGMFCLIDLLFVMYRLFLLWLFRLFLFIFSFQKAKILL